MIGARRGLVEKMAGTIAHEYRLKSGMLVGKRSILIGELIPHHYRRDYDPRWGTPVALFHLRRLWFYRLDSRSEHHGEFDDGQAFAPRFIQNSAGRKKNEFNATPSAPTRNLRCGLNTSLNIPNPDRAAEARPLFTSRAVNA